MIARSWLDGTHRKPIVTDKISNPTDISIDILTHDVYWVDTQEDAIYKVDYKGEQKQIIRRNTPSPRGLSILKGDIYWVDRNLENIFKASKLPKQVASPEIVKTGLQKLRDIVLVDRQNQPLDKMNPCYKSGNGNCEQLCFSYPSDEKPSITKSVNVHLAASRTVGNVQSLRNI
jgi:low density lipoprotein-related protein 2